MQHVPQIVRQQFVVAWSSLVWKPPWIPRISSTATRCYADFLPDEVFLSLTTGPQLTRLQKNSKILLALTGQMMVKVTSKRKFCTALRSTHNRKQKAVTMNTFRTTIGIAACVGVLAASATSVFAVGDIFTIGDASDVSVSSSLLVQTATVQLTDVGLPTYSIIPSVTDIALSAPGAGVGSDILKGDPVTPITTAPVTYSTTPEPGTMMLGALGGGMLWFVRSRRQARRN
jgi:hypothetical protein